MILFMARSAFGVRCSAPLWMRSGVLVPTLSDSFRLGVLVSIEFGEIHAFTFAQ
jgi:hypothetical protein